MNSECSVWRVLIFSVNFAPGYPRRYTARSILHLKVLERIHMKSETPPAVQKGKRTGKSPMASVRGKRAYAKLGGLTPAMFGSTVFELHKDRLVELTKGPILSRDCHVSIAEIDSAEVVRCGNQLYLILGIATLAIYGLGLLFIVLYFMRKHKFLLIHSSANVLALNMRGDEEPFHEFKNNVIKVTSHYKLN